MNILYEIVTTEAGKAMGIAIFKIEPGAPAYLEVLDLPNLRETLRYHRTPQYDLSHGHLNER